LRPLLARVLLACLLSIALLAAIAWPRAGHFLIVGDPLQPADAILVLGGTDAEGWLEAVDLYRERMAPAIVLSPGIAEPAAIRVRQMGIRFPAYVDLAIDAMVQLGVPRSAVAVLPGALDNTGDEAAQARQLAARHRWTNLIVVTAKYHTRRSRFAFRRELRNTPIRIQIRGSRHDDAQPDQWWKSRSDLRYVTSELQKLLAYRLGLDR